MENRPCPEGKIRNPITGRCVNRDGKLGKKIYKNNIRVNFNEEDKQNPINRNLPLNGNKIGRPHFSPLVRRALFRSHFH